MLVPATVALLPGFQPPIPPAFEIRVSCLPIPHLLAVDLTFPSQSVFTSLPQSAPQFNDSNLMSE